MRGLISYKITSASITVQYLQVQPLIRFPILVLYRGTLFCSRTAHLLQHGQLSRYVKLPDQLSVCRYSSWPKFSEISPVRASLRRATKCLIIYEHEADVQVRSGSHICRGMIGWIGVDRYRTYSEGALGLAPSSKCKVLDLPCWAERETCNKILRAIQVRRGRVSAGPLIGVKGSDSSPPMQVPVVISLLQEFPGTQTYVEPLNYGKALEHSFKLISVSKAYFSGTNFAPLS